jgi:hypothetical protein
LKESLRLKLSRLRLEELTESFTPGRASRRRVQVSGLPKASVDALITSPPFLGTTEFLRQNRVRLWFCGMDYARQQGERQRFVEYNRTLDYYADVLREWARIIRRGGRLVMHLGVVGKRDMACELGAHIETAGFQVRTVIYENTGRLESHGRTDRGATHTHQFLVAVRA